MIFVFGSNLGGRHGRGSAAEAYQKHGAIYGQGVGRQGNSYAIPTKDAVLRILSKEVIEVYVREFLDYALEHPEEVFNVVEIGCGLAGYMPEDIAPMFYGAPKNVALPRRFETMLMSAK